MTPTSTQPPVTDPADPTDATESVDAVAPLAATHEGSSPETAPTRWPARDPWLDNAKFCLVTLVVMGHTLVGMSGRIPEAHVLRTWIYAFHIPAFVFLAGYVSRSRQLRPNQLQRVTTRLVAPYLIFSAIYGAATVLKTGTNQADLVDPYWLLWFLPALAAWRLGTPLLLNLRWPLVLAVVVGLAVGAVDRVGAQFTLSRIVALAPFFVLGAVLPRDVMDRLRTRTAAAVGAVVLLGSLVAAALVDPRLGGFPRFFYWNQGYEGLGQSLGVGLGTRAAMYVVSTVLLLAVMAVVPRGRNVLTALGAASIYIYLLHGLIVRGLQWSGFYDRVTGWPMMVLILAGCVVVAAALASPPVRRLTRPLVEPRLAWLLARADPAERTDRARAH